MSAVTHAVGWKRSAHLVYGGGWLRVCTGVRAGVGVGVDGRSRCSDHGLRTKGVFGRWAGRGDVGEEGMEIGVQLVVCEARFVIVFVGGWG